jgi:two-component system, NtrC family, sensor kinase
MKIMIVEDDPVSLALLKKALGKTETSIITAKNGAEAWGRFNQDHPRIVISDWMLPELSGIELCRKIRETQTPVYTYIIIMTAKDSKDDVLATFDAGADDYVAKPYDIRELYARMNTGKRIIQLEDRHHALQQTLINSRARIRTVFDALPEEIISVDRDVKLVSINKAASKVMECNYSEVVGKPCNTVSAEAESSFYDQTMYTMVQEGFQTGRPDVFLDRYHNADGKEIIKERTFLPVIDEDGQVQTVTIVSRDITEAHQRNEEIQNLNNKLKKISSELIKKNMKLENALQNLERTQAQMVQSEKMASIGQLAAGVAHEINNPTGFVSSNLKTLADYQHDMNQLIGDYQKLKAALRQLPDGQLPAAIDDLVAQVESTEQDVDIEYIQEDVGELIGDCREGTERIKKIVDDLKHFAHPGEDKMKETDINAGIESTLNVVNNELKYKATIVKELGDIPIIHGYPQQLNQVFMNILVNAAQAIEKSGEIKIVTGSVDGKVEIRISDTGCGISKENLNKIFDPFFTTKDVGKGTGLGMNIAYNIITKHNGDIRVESTVGKGTTFIIQLPVESLPDGEEHSSTGQPVSQ